MTLEEYRKKYNYDACTGFIRQYLDIKYEHQDCLLLFRMGDFYELFFEDAYTAGEILGIAVTKRGKVGDQDIAMCGVPHHALYNYLPKLLEQGYNAAICDQTETPEEAKRKNGYKAIVNRAVTQIITPGTVLEESLISPERPHYIASLTISKDKAAICYADMSTSRILFTQVPSYDMIDQLARIAPKELILSEIHRGKDYVRSIECEITNNLTYRPEGFFDLKNTTKSILEFYRIHSVEAICEVSDTQVISIGSLIQYLTLTQKSYLKTLPLPKYVSQSKFMHIDSSTRRSLELVSSSTQGIKYGLKSKSDLLSCINRTVTHAGTRLLYNYLSAPLVEIDRIKKRLEITDAFYRNPKLLAELRLLLSKTSDIERAITRIVMNRSLPRDLLAIKNTLLSCLKLKEAFIGSYCLSIPSSIEPIYKGLSGDGELLDLIDSSIREDSPHQLNDGGFIKHEYHLKLSELYSLINDHKSRIEKLKEKYRILSGADNLKISHNNLLGLFIEVTSKQSTKMTDPIFIHRQTTLNTVRYSSQELQKLETDIVNARSLSVALEQELYREICNKVAEKKYFLYDLAYNLSKLDVFTNLAHIAIEYNYVKPLLSDSSKLTIESGRHPTVERNAIYPKRKFTANDCVLSEELKVALITGPNMAGKSTYLRQNALIVILAQMGSFVPAAFSEIGIVDKVFSRVGSGDDLFGGKSTFMVEMTETSSILSQATDRSLIILDEVGRGTSTFDGISIAWAILEHIHDIIRARCLFATHYHELIDLEKSLTRLGNYTIEIEEYEGEILFLHKIKSGGADKSYGVQVARLAGLPEQVISKAEAILKVLENSEIARESKNITKSEATETNIEFKSNVSDKRLLPTPSDKLLKALESIQPDSLSPKEALDLIYQLKKMTLSNI
jgi:DNA mismatch repair protein MutS